MKNLVILPAFGGIWTWQLWHSLPASQPLDQKYYWTNHTDSYAYRITLLLGDKVHYEYWGLDTVLLPVSNDSN